MNHTRNVIVVVAVRVTHRIMVSLMNQVTFSLSVRYRFPFKGEKTPKTILQWLHHPINDFGNLVARLMGIDSEQDIYWVIAQLYSFSLNENDHMTIIFALKHRIRFCWRNYDYIDCNVVQGWFFHFWKVLQLMPLIIMHHTLFISTISWVLEFFRIVVRLRKVGMLPKNSFFLRSVVVLLEYLCLSTLMLPSFCSWELHA